MLLLLTGASGVGKSICRIAIEAVVQRALAGDRDLLLAGDPVSPGELIAAPSVDRLDRIAVCLLGCHAASQTERLAGADWSFDVIDTSGRAAADVAADSLTWVRAVRSCP